MKKKHWLVTAAVVGMALTGSAGVYAGTNLESIKASLNHGLGIQVNGSVYTPTANGKKLAPISYQGTTYLPVRSIGEALNIPVSFDAASNKVIIGSGSSTGTPATPAVSTAVIKTKYLPTDFPFPKDAKQVSLVENVADNKKQVSLLYSTKSNLLELGNTYKDYYLSKDVTKKSEIIEADNLSIVSSKDNDFVVSINSSPITNQTGAYEISVVWKEQ
ncbi:stalk domain-containing protein [Paenibacillus nuruki]|uniref:stalk domain-containing protein n=1 Tax=Paenibacillus nuruki TaxID=1886670 RepID=UPI0028052AE4|nr:stalk domain-containing protein [Paenibacillus nuruki]CAJ1317619.1 Cu-amine-oxidN1 domain-containing protein [Paenibacillus nuruki]